MRRRRTRTIISRLPADGPATRSATADPVKEDAEAMDVAVDQLAGELAGSHPDAMANLKRVLWEGTEHWDELLMARAEVSGRLVLSDFTRDAIAAFKA